MSGRGRGINNAPAWMTRGDRGPPEHDAFGRLSRPPDMRRMPPPPMGDRGHPPRNGRGPPPRGPPPGGYDDRHDDRGRHNDRDRGRGPPRRARGNSSGITFRSYEEERDWVMERRRKRLSRKSKFDVPPTPHQIAADAAALALSNPAATDFAGIPADRNFAAVPQQTRHARRLYIGHLPPNVTEDELHSFFKSAIQQALVDQGPPEDPILSVYINHERRFCFLEFKTVEMTTACLALDGIDIHGKGKVKVKRPNDYNPAMAPEVHPSAIPELDVSKLGIISGTVQDGPNKIFIGGLHYHLTENQVLELLQAFGKVKAFHLVKNDPDSLTSKGYCFVEYADPNNTHVAVIGLNGMDLGGGKVLTARVAGERAGVVIPNNDAATTATSAAAAAAAAVPVVALGANPVIPAVAAPSLATLAPSLPRTGPSAGRSDAMIINGYDVETLVDAAMGLRSMPTAPVHIDEFGVPISRVPAAAAVTAAVTQPPPVIAPPPQLPPQLASHYPMPPQAPVPSTTTALPPGASALDIANAALDAAFGSSQLPPVAVPPPPPPPPPPIKSRILVLHNMVSDDDLATDEEYHGLMEEVQGECAKYGKLVSMKVPRTASQDVAPSAIKKIFLEYATAQDAKNSDKEISGRQFGPNVVETTYYPEADYLSGKLR